MILRPPPAPDDSPATHSLEASPAGPGPRETELEGEPSRLKRMLGVLGPGLIAGASHDDPSGIAVYAKAGATLGFAPLWTALVTLPLLASTQFISSKIALVSGVGLVGVLREHYSRKLLYPVTLGLVIAN